MGVVIGLNIYIYIYIYPVLRIIPPPCLPTSFIWVYSFRVTFWSFLVTFGVTLGHFLVILATHLEAFGVPVAKWLLLGNPWEQKQKQRPTRQQLLRILGPPFLTFSRNSMKKDASKNGSKQQVVFKCLFKALGTWKMKLCTVRTEQNNRSVVQKTHFGKQQTMSWNCHGKGSLWGSPGDAFRGHFGASWETNRGKWRFPELLFCVCFWGTEKGSASHATSQQRGGLGPFNWLNWIELLITELLNYWITDSLN